MASAFDSAFRKLLEGTPPFPLVDLPASRDDSLWADLRNEYGLSLAELSSLKNHVSGEQSTSSSVVNDLLRDVKSHLEHPWDAERVANSKF